MKATILIVDDRASNRDYVATLLGYAGHRLLQAADGAQALACVRAEHPDLVITDILMPTMDGFEFVQHLRADPALAATPVIFHTATYSAPEAKSLAASCGALAVLPKPCEPKEMLEAVGQAIGKLPPATAARIARRAALHAPGSVPAMRADDTLDIYLEDLRTVKAGIDKLSGSEAKAHIRRSQAKALSDKLSEKVLHLQRIMSRLSALIEVGMEMDRERRPARLAEIFFGAIGDIVESKIAAIALFEDGDASPEHVFAKGVESILFREPGNIRHGLLGATLAQRPALRINAIDSALGVDSLPAGHPPVRNFLGISIATESRAYGWIYFASKSVGDFDAEDERLAAIMAAKLALLYENLQLYGLIQRHAAKLQIEAKERKQAQEALRHSEAGLRRAQQLARLAHVITGPGGAFESWSENLPALIGVDAAQMPRSTRAWLELVHADDRQTFRVTAIEAGTDSERRDIEYRLLRADGTWINVEQVLEPMAYGSGPAGEMRWFNTLQDVTDRKRAEQELYQLHAAVNVTTDSIYLTDVTSLRFLFVNDAACRRLGYTREQLLAKAPEEVLGASQDEIRSEYAQTVAGGENGMRFERRYLRADGSEAWTELHRRALLSGAGPLVVSIGRDITDRKRAEAVLSESEARFRSLTALSSDWYWEQDEELRFTKFSGGEGDRKWGPDQPAQIGKRRWELPDITPLNATWEEHRAVLAARVPFRDFEYVRIAHNGDRHFTSANGEPVFDPGGRFKGYRGTARDITERKRGEEQLRRFRLAMDGSADLILLTDRATMRHVDANETACRLLGYTREELLRIGPADLLPVSRESLEQAYDALIADPSTIGSMKSHYRCKDGSLLPFESTRRILHSGNSWILVAVSRDIRERIHSENALLAAERRFRSIFENSVDGIFQTTLSGKIVSANPASAHILGYASPDELIAEVHDVGKQLYADPADRVSFSRKLAEDGTVRAFETRFQRKDGQVIWVSLSASVEVDPVSGERNVQGSIQDITGRKDAQEKIARLTRVQAVMSGINALIVRATDRDEILRGSCRIAVETGGFRMAWVGMVDQDALRLEIAASAGADDEYLGKIPLGLSESGSAPFSIAGQVVRDRAPIVVDDLAIDPRVVIGKEALQRALRSLAILPLLVGGDAAGALALYATETGFFDDAEMKLLGELASDISFALEHVERGRKLEYLALYDPLTGLANRVLLLDRLGQRVRAAGQSAEKCAVVLADVERLRSINDSLGRLKGDAILKQLAERLETLTSGDDVARIGADQFAVILGPVKGKSEVTRRIESIWQACFGVPFAIDDSALRIAAKAGIALSPNDGSDADTLLRNAEAALRQAKASGDRHVYHATEMTARTAEKLSLENSLRQALEREEFVLHYQPKVDLETKSIVGVEALIRWQSPDKGLVPPGRFIPLLEETGLILDAGAWALRRAVLDHRHWLRQGIPAPRIAVNVSAIQLRQKNFVDVVKECIATGANPTGIDIEVTESLLMENIDDNIRKLGALRDLGMKISIDDFGTGYSSLGYLAKLPVHTLKIDRSFIITMLNDPNTMTLVSTIISLAHSLRLTVVAEGVELEEQAKMLRLLRCDQMQGYLFSRPVPFADLTPLLQSKANGGSTAGAQT